MLQRILVALDGSPLAESALPYATNLARVSGATVVLVQAALIGETLEFFDADTTNLVLRYDPPSPGAPADPLTARQVASDARDYLASLARNLHPEGIKCETVVVPGDAADVVVDEAKRRHADLIVMSTHGRSGLGRLLYGSVAESVIANTTVPVLMVRSGMPPRGLPTALSGLRLLVSLDGSPTAERALPVAADLARALNAELTLIRVIPSSPSPTPIKSTQPKRQESRGRSDSNDDAAETYLDVVAKPLKAEGLRVSTRLTNNHPADGIISAAQETGADLIVMATHGRTGLGRAILGSVALDVVRRGTRPVILVPASSA